MRVATAAELEALELLDRQELVRVRIEDDQGTMVDRSGRFARGTVSVSQDQMAATAEIELQREVDGDSIAPLMDSEEALAFGRRVTIDVAVLPLEASVSEDDWKRVFDGQVDDSDWGGAGPTITVPCRDHAATLHDVWIEEEREYGDDDSPPAVEDVIQEVLDDALGEGEVTLHTVGDPDAGIRLYEQSRGRVDQAIEGLAETIGWDIRYRWDDTAEAYRLTLAEPDRDAATPVHTFSTDDYWGLDEVAIRTAGLRDRVVIVWTEEATGDVVTSVAETPEPVLPPHRRTAILDYAQDARIRTEAQAQTLATAVLSDLSDAAVTQVASHALWWPVELGDLYTWPANAVHYDADQTLAVVGYTHELVAGEPGTTTLECRGRPRGSLSIWRERRRRTEDKDERDEDDPEIPDPPVLPSFEVTTEKRENPNGQLVGVYGVKLHDPDGMAQEVLRRTKQGPDDPAAWTSLDAEPSDGATYEHQVELVDGHPSAIEFRGVGEFEGRIWYFTARSAPFDAGKIPAVQVDPVYDPNQGQPDADPELSANLIGNFSARSHKVLATEDSPPSEADVEAEAAIDGRRLSPSDVGVLLTPPVGATVYVAAIPYSEESGGGEAGEMVVVERKLDLTEPDLEAEAEKPFLDDGSWHGRYGVLVTDPSAIARELRFRTREEDADWTDWSLKTDAPQHEVSYEETVALEEEDWRKLAFQLEYRHYGAPKVVQQQSGQFRIPGMPELRQIEPVHYGGGEYGLEWKGSRPTASITAIAYVHPDDEPADLRQAVEGGQAFDGRAGETGDGSPLITDPKDRDRIRFAALAWNQPNGAGEAEAEIHFASVRHRDPDKTDILDASVPFPWPDFSAFPPKMQFELRVRLQVNTGNQLIAPGHIEVSASSDGDDPADYTLNLDQTPDADGYVTLVHTVKDGDEEASPFLWDASAVGTVTLTLRYYDSGGLFRQQRTVTTAPQNEVKDLTAGAVAEDASDWEEEE